MSEIAEFLPGIALAFTIVLLGLLTPGPNVMAIIGTSVGSGRIPGTALAMGVAVGSGLWACLAVTGLTSLLSTYANVLIVLKVVGGAYLIWLGLKSLRSATKAKVVANDALELGVRWKVYFARGLAIQMSNPKAALTMLAIVAVGLPAGAPVWVALMLILGITTLSVVGHAVYALAFSAKPVVGHYMRIRRWVEATLGVVFCVAGARLIASKD